MDAKRDRQQHVTTELPAGRTTTDEVRGATLVAELLARRWVVPVLAVLHDGPRRHFQIALAVRNVSAKVLTETLRYLEAEGIVERRLVQTADTAGAGYALTARGDALNELVVPLGTWWATHDLRTRQRETGTG